MQRILSLTLIVLLNINFAFAQFAGGDGTADDPYLIADCTQLQAIDNAAFLEARFLQTADIDCSGIANFNPIGGTFRGSYNGQNFVISDLTINRPSENSVGLFSTISSGSVINLKLKDSTVTGRNLTGTLAGTLVTSSQVVNIEINNTVVNGVEVVGGLMGSMTSSSEALQVSVSGAVSGSTFSAGGIAGLVSNSATLVSDVSFAGSVSGPNGIAGVVGLLQDGASIANSANYGTVTSSNATAAGIAGLSFRSAISVLNSFNIGLTAPRENIVAQAENGTIIDNAYFSSSASGSTQCVGVDNGATINTCQDVDSPTEQPDYFRDSTNEPMASWDFADAWQNCDEGDTNAFTLIGMCESSTLNSVAADFNGSQNLVVALNTKNKLAANSRVTLTFPEGKYDLVNAMLVGATAGELLAVDNNQLIISLNNASELAVAVDLSYEISGISELVSPIATDMLVVSTVNLKTGAAVDSAEVAAPLADACLEDPNKTEPGVCGCGIADDDTDMDGQLNCQETCPMDADKTEPGICGCGTADTDSDSDSTADCNDMCPNDAAKVMPGACGCGTADTDEDNNQIADCRDEEPAFELSEKVLKRINRLTVNTPKRRLFGANKLLNLVKRLDNPEIKLLARRLKAVSRRIRRSQNNGSLTSRELARLKQIAQRRINRLQAALQAADDS